MPLNVPTGIYPKHATSTQSSPYHGGSYTDGHPQKEERRENLLAASLRIGVFEPTDSNLARRKTRGESQHNQMQQRQRSLSTHENVSEKKETISSLDCNSPNMRGMIFLNNVKRRSPSIDNVLGAFLFGMVARLLSCPCRLEDFVCADLILSYVPFACILGV